MPDVLVLADSIRSPEMRHEVPVAIPDPFLYAEHDGRRVVVVSALEVERVGAAGLEVVPVDALGIDDLLAQGVDRDEAELRVYVRACRELGVTDALCRRASRSSSPTGSAERVWR